jgi:hypothetical protein
VKSRDKERNEIKESERKREIRWRIGVKLIYFFWFGRQFGVLIVVTVIVFVIWSRLQRNHFRSNLTGALLIVRLARFVASPDFRFRFVVLVVRSGSARTGFALLSRFEPFERSLDFGGRLFQLRVRQIYRTLRVRATTEIIIDLFRLDSIVFEGASNWERTDHNYVCLFKKI